MKKAFTLVEVLATIIILAIIMTIIVPNVNKIITNGKKTSQDNLEKFIYKSTERYVIDNNIVITPTSDECIQISTLKTSGYLKDKDIKDATNGESLNDYCVRVTMSDNQNVYDLKPNITLGEKLFADGETGLVEDVYEPGRYYYRGESPKNKIILKENVSNTLTDIDYRIISFEKDGTIKVVREDRINIYGNQWDDESSNRNSTQDTYCIDSHCNAWGNQYNTYRNGTLMNNYFSLKYYENNTATEMVIDGRENDSKTTVAKDSSLNTYLNGTYLTTNLSQISNYIDEHMWDVGGIYDISKDFAKDIEESKVNQWKGYIALPSIIDFKNASDNTTQCTNVYSNTQLVGSYHPCSKNDDGNINNYLYKSNYLQWSLSAQATYRRYAWCMTWGGEFDNYPVNYTCSTRPSFYLKSSTKLTGTGTSTDPYTILN